MPDAPADTDSFLDAVRGGDVSRVRQLLAADRGLAATRDPAGISALMLARYHGHPDVAAAILEAGPDLDVHEAAIAGDRDRVQAHLDADPALANARSADGFTPLHFAAFFGDAATAQLLLERGADPRAVAENALRVTPLHSAAAARNADVAHLVLDAGADPNARENGGYTPLHTAADNGDGPLAALLLEHGADRSAVADDGRTPADVARAKGHDALAETLERATS
jgi:ankyrin repeat protein